MNLIEQKIRKLEKENQQQADYIEFLKEDINGLKKSKEVLKKRLLEEKVLFDGFIRQGLKITNGNKFYGWHYVVFPISGIPGTLNILDVRELIQETLKLELATSEFKNYVIESIDFSQRRNVWYVQMGHAIELNRE